MRDGWARRALGEFLTLSRRRVQPDADTEYMQVTLAINGKGARLRKRVLGSELASTQYIAQRGDLLISKIDARKGAAAVLGPELDGAVVTGDFPAFEIDGEIALSRFVDLLVRRPQFADLCDTISAGTTNRVRMDLQRFPDLEIELPPIEEQRRIVDLVAALDGAGVLAAEEQGRARLLRDVALASEFGRHADVLMRPLGEVSTARLGKMLSKASTEAGEQLPYVRNADVQWDDLRLGDLNTMHFTDRERVEFALRAGDVLICEGGEVGRTAIVDRDIDGIYFQKAIHRVRCCDELEPRFLLHYMRYCALTGGLDNYSTQMTIQHLTGEKLRLLPIPVPGLDEQRATVALLDAISSVERSARKEEMRLRSLRAALLSDLLSGDREVPASYDSLLEPA